MQEKNEIYQLTLDFSIRIVNLNKYLCQQHHEQIMSKQLLRCGTSIGANVTEALAACSKRDFLNKMYIAYKESCESLYWIDLLFKTDYLSEKSYTSISTDCKSIRNILSKITKTTKENLEKGNTPSSIL